MIASGISWAQQPNPALARLVRLAPGTRPLGTVLTELARQGNLPLSYSSSLVPMTHLYTQRPGPARPLGVVLQEVLATEHLSYGLLAGQLVLWPTSVAAPIGVTSVNGQSFRVASSPATRADELPAVPPVVPSKTGATAPAASSRNPTNRPVIPAGPRGLRLSGAATSAPASEARLGETGGQLYQKLTPATAPGTSRNFPTKNSPINSATTPSASAAQTNLTRGSKPNKLPPRAAFAAKQRASNPSDHVAMSTLLHGNQSRAGEGTKSQRTGLEEILTTSSASARRSSQLRGAIDSLPFLRSTLSAAPAMDGAGLVVVALATGPSVTASPARVIDPANKPAAKASLLPPSYLHGEAWLSESLPLSAAVKVGVPRIYLVLGVAAGSPGPQSGGVAWGVGLGTAGQPRGRFTPSLDLVHWFVGGGRETTPSSLTQLRPQLGWQLKQGGRWQLFGGPTLNLATARRRGPPPQRWDFGRDQWLWVNQMDYDSSLRLWPGVQVGLRF